MDEIEICNLALSRLGDKNTIEDITDPTKPQEKVFAKWYDITRKNTLKRMMPSFSIKREKWALSSYVPEFGYKKAYEYHSDCLKILGIGDLTNNKNNYSVEGKYLLCDEDYNDGIPVRFIKDVKNTACFTSDFIELLSFELAYNVCNEISADLNMSNNLFNIVKLKRVEFSGIDSQENKPLRISESKYNRTGYNYQGKK